ncbi:glutathione S-transferase N-terminal domain-containing protein [Acidiferrobacter sp. SPIII_3]|uniref:glutathione S-transferase N-terminal domain-containing protein n=1 Tax=Acidiferrobacter sp. SPIII_3 TaxID=1281578 RepID=UPI00197A9682|nr:glutathione S-transferase N-terminal domain-containing protein [Acidiferrobacter sp. SPIII_3]
MILILCGRCELPLAPDILLREAGVPFTRERVDLVAKRWRNGDYREITPKAYVPALRLEDGDILTECAVILSDIADQAPRQGLMPLAGSRARYHACAWLNFLATEVHGNFITPERHGGVAANFLANTEEGQAATRVLVAPRLEYIDRMRGGRRFLTGESLAVPDADLFVMFTGPCASSSIAHPGRGSRIISRTSPPTPAVSAAREIEGPPHALRS